MMKINYSNLKLGIIAGGQLGKMLIQEASKWDIATYVLDQDQNAPAASIATRFFQGSRFDFQTVYDFGKQVDVLTFEIESINVDALFQLKKEGIEVIPDPTILQLFQNKEKQKDFYVKNRLPTANFKSFSTKEEILRQITNHKSQITNNDSISAPAKYESFCIGFPFVQKLKTGGYDGRGVAVIRSEADLPELLEGESIVEELIDIEKEIAVIVARNKNGEVRCFPAVEMVFNPTANLVERLLCPANISPEQHKMAERIACELITKLNMQGILAIEFFVVTPQTPSKKGGGEGSVIINESAPRPHNSGHHTIESVMTSQYEQHLRAILNLPLGSTEIKMPSVMINLLGEADCEGPVNYEGLEKALAIEGVKIHLYGKKITKPYRKMGHVTIIDKDLKKAMEKADDVSFNLKVVTDF